MSRSRRRGVFAALPRAVYRRAGPRHLDAWALGVVGNGVVVAGFGAGVVLCFVDLSAGEAALFAACSAAGYVVESLVAGREPRRVGAPVRAWLEGGAAEPAWSPAAGLPLALVRRRRLYAIGAVSAVASSLVPAALLGRPAYEAAWALPVLWLFYVSSAVLRYIALELGMRPLLQAIGTQLREPPAPDEARVSLHWRLLVMVPMVTWGAGMVVAGLITADTRRLDTLGHAGLLAFGVSAAISMWLGLVLADAVTGPVIDLRDATRRVAPSKRRTRTSSMPCTI